jgi:hypothetical protein
MLELLTSLDSRGLLLRYLTPPETTLLSMSGHLASYRIVQLPRKNFAIIGIPGSLRAIFLPLLLLGESTTSFRRHLTNDFPV